MKLSEAFKTYSNFGDFLKYYRNLNGISSKKLSAMVNKGSSYVSQIENKRIITPNYDVASEMLKLLGMEQELIHNTLRTYNIVSMDKEPSIAETFLYESATGIFNEYLKEGNIEEKDEDIEKNKELYEKLEVIVNKFKLLIQSSPHKAMKLLAQTDTQLNKNTEEAAREWGNRLMSDPDVLRKLISIVDSDLELNKK